MTPSPVLITGLGAVTAFGAGVPALAEGLRRGTTAITACEAGDSGQHWAATVGEVDVAALLPPGLPAALAERCLRLTRRAARTTRAGVLAAAEAYVDAGLSALPADRVALMVAGTNTTGRVVQAAAAAWTQSPAHVAPRYALQMLDTDLVGVVSDALGLHGEGATVGAAAASGNSALIAGARIVACGAADACLVLGALWDPTAVELRAFANIGALCGPEQGIPFDANRSGFVPGEASAAVVLQSAASVAGHGAPALAALRGWAARLDANSLADPSLSGETAVMRAAMAHAGIDPSDVAYVNAHGTGTDLGDRTEAEAIVDVFGQPTPWVNSTKSLLGHCMTSAGVVETVATVLQLRTGWAHPNAGLAESLDKCCRFAGATGAPLAGTVALSTGFGFGGFSTCLVLDTGPAAGPG